MADLGDIGGGLLPDVTREINGPEEWMSLQVVGPIPSQPVVGCAAQFGDEVPGLGAQLDLGWNVERVLPVYDLRDNKTKVFLSFHILSFI